MKKLERRKAPAPDDIPTETVKDLDEENPQNIPEVLKTWRRNERIQAKELRARVVPLPQKGDTHKF